MKAAAQPKKKKKKTQNQRKKIKCKCPLLWLFASAAPPKFASISSDLHVGFRKPCEFYQWYARILFHRDLIAKHCPIEKLD